MILPRDQKQVGQLKSRLRGKFVTSVGMINAIDNKLPSVTKFPNEVWNDRQCLS